LKNSLEGRVIIPGAAFFSGVCVTGIELWSWPARTRQRFREDDEEPGPETARYLVQLTPGDENGSQWRWTVRLSDERKGDLKFDSWKTVRQVHHARHDAPDSV
jgi:hypothetical protein